MPLGEGVPLERKCERGTPLMRRYSTAIGSFNLKMVVDRHRYAAYHNKHSRQAFLKMSTSMTLNDLEPTKRGV